MIEHARQPSEPGMAFTMPRARPGCIVAAPDAFGTLQLLPPSAGLRLLRQPRAGRALRTADASVLDDHLHVLRGPLRELGEPDAEAAQRSFVPRPADLRLGEGERS